MLQQRSQQSALGPGSSPPCGDAERTHAEEARAADAAACSPSPTPVASREKLPVIFFRGVPAVRRTAPNSAAESSRSCPSLRPLNAWRPIVQERAGAGSCFTLRPSPALLQRRRPAPTSPHGPQGHWLHRPEAAAPALDEPLTADPPPEANRDGRLASWLAIQGPATGGDTGGERAGDTEGKGGEDHFTTKPAAGTVPSQGGVVATPRPGANAAVTDRRLIATSGTSSRSRLCRAAGMHGRST